MPEPPGNDVIGARGITAHTQSTQQLSIGRIQRQSAAKDVDPADSPADHRVMSSTVGRYRAGIGDARIDRIALLQTKQAPARLNRRIQVGRALGKAREAECVGGIGFLRRDHPAAGPLVTPVLAAEHHVYHLAVPIQNGSPHLEPQAAVLLLQDSAELAAKGVVIALMRGLRPRKYPRDRGPQGALFGGAYGEADRKGGTS